MLSSNVIISVNFFLLSEKEFTIYIFNNICGMRKFPNSLFRTLLQIGPWAQHQESRTQAQSITKTQI